MVDEARQADEQSTLRRARILGLPYYDTSRKSDKVLYKDLIGSQELTDLRVVPLEVGQDGILFGVINTTAQTTMTNLRQRFMDQRVSFALISEMGFREYMKLYNPPKQIQYHNIELTTAGSDALVAQVSSTLDQVRADDMLAYLVQQAHRLKASDIHTETQRGYVRIRFRIDGVLHPIAKLTPEKYRILVSAIASAASISTQALDSQQGHIAQSVKMADGANVNVNLRVETVPAIHGMDVVMRLFNLQQDMYTLDKLGLDVKERKVVDDIIAKPSGLVMVVGPTGSGKTTTLYSMLNSLNNDSRKIITIEDPVEYQFEGLTQIPVRSQGLEDTSFAERLRAVLRLDPDVVMIGEIRDMDTARTALQASLTGHLVLSTFHAGSAAAALTRLMDIIGDNPLFASAIRLVMSQRLVRKLDDESKQAYEPSEQDLHYIDGVLASMPDNIDRPSLDGLKLYRPGSSASNPYGYRGQIALREQFLMTPAILKLMQEGRLTATAEIEQAAIGDGMKTMRHDAVLKVIAGQTTLQEVARVLG